MNDWNQPPPPPIPQPGLPPGAPPPGAATPWSPPAHAGGPAELRGLNLWLVLPLVGVTALSCGVAGLPFNATALVFAILARTAHGRHDLDRARTQLRRAKIFGSIGLALALANIAFGVTAAITSGTSS